MPTAHGSRVRESQGIAFEGITWPERFVATNIRYPFEAAGYSQTTMLIDDPYGAIITKIDNSGDTGLWRYTYCEDAALPEDGIVNERMPDFFASIVRDPENVVVDAYSPYSMHQRAASNVPFRTVCCWPVTPRTQPTRPAGSA